MGKMVALNHWNNAVLKKEKMKNPDFKKPAPGPGQYIYENSEAYRKTKSFSQSINKTGFLSNSDRKIHDPDPV
jgi:hypothetical protein